jgi:hypothetical protein
VNDDGEKYACALLNPPPSPTRAHHAPHPRARHPARPRARRPACSCSCSSSQCTRPWRRSYWHTRCYSRHVPRAPTRTGIPKPKPILHVSARIPISLPRLRHMPRKPPRRIQPAPAPPHTLDGKTCCIARMTHARSRSSGSRAAAS